MDARARAEHDLDEFDDDLAFQRRFWSAERAAWLGFVLLLAAALAGLTGAGGPLAHATVETPYGAIEYPRIARWQAGDSMEVRFATEAPDSASVEIGQTFIDTFEIDSIHPEPVSATATPNGVRYTFDVERGGKAVFQIRARRPSLLPDAVIRIGDAEAPVRPLILP